MPNEPLYILERTLIFIVLSEVQSTTPIKDQCVSTKLINANGTIISTLKKFLIISNCPICRSLRRLVLATILASVSAYWLL